MSATAVKEKVEVQTGPIADVPNEANALALATPTAQPPAIGELHATPLVTFTPAQVDIIKHMYMPGATDDELAVFISVCTSRQLNPFVKQIYAIKRSQKRDGKYVQVWTHQTSIDGFRLVAKRTQKYRGQTIPLYCDQGGTWVEAWLQSAPPAAAKVGVLHEDFDQPIYAVALWREYVQTFEDGNPMAMWAKMPTIMLAKVAEALALRKAFPEELSGLYTDDEMAQAANADRAASRREGQTQAGESAGSGASGTSAPARPAAPAAPAAPADPYDVDVKALTLEQARAMPLYGQADSWNGYGQKPLGAVPEKVLRRAFAWFGEMLDNPPADRPLKPVTVARFQLMRAAIPLVLAAIDEGQGQLPLQPAVESPSATSAAAGEDATRGGSASSTSAHGTTNVTTERSEADDSDVPVEKSIDELRAELRELMDNPVMPKEARSYFATRIMNGKVASLTSARLHIAIAKTCVQIGDELVHAMDERRQKEIAGLLLHATTYKPDTLAKIRDQLAIAHPGTGGRSPY